MNNETHSDIKPQSFILRALPLNLRPYALLARLDRPVGVWLLLLPGWWGLVLGAHAGAGGLMTPRLWGLMALFAAGAVVMRAAGCVINDLWDRDLDRQVARTRARPIASGAISPRAALLFLFLLLLAGFLILLQMNALTILLGVLTLPMIAVYPLMKRITLWPQAFLGLTFNFGALMGHAAAADALGAPAFLLYAGGIFWTLGYDTVYALQDREDDALAGIKSTALYFGDGAARAVGWFYGTAWVLWALALACVAPAPLTGFAAAAPAGLHMAWLLRRLRPADPQNALENFRRARITGLLLLAGLAAIALF